MKEIRYIIRNSRYFLLLMFSLMEFSTVMAQNSIADVVPTSDELQLYELIMQYRQSCGLRRIPLSPSLTYVAQVHARDVVTHDGQWPSGCNMHSWSDDGPWSRCDYYPDHRNMNCMHNKPRELTPYKGNGYEISYGFTSSSSSNCTPEGALKGWMSSSGHNAVILNHGIWAEYPWKAIGVGMYKGYACVWFGEETDPMKFRAASSQQTKPQPQTQLDPSSWTANELSQANTAYGCDYMSNIEKDVLKYINLARMYPKKFADLEVKPFLHPQGYGVHSTFPQYKQSLLNHLYSMEPMQALRPDYKYYQLAYCWAEESSRLGVRGHQRVNCPKGDNAECCAYGVYTAIDIVLQWLIDDPVPSLGHRKICLNSKYMVAGVAFMRHPTEDHVTVLDIK